MSYTLRQVKAGWEIQNGSSITVTVPDLKSVEKAVTMLAENSKMTVGEMLTKKPADEAEPVTRKSTVETILQGAKKSLTVREIIERIGDVEKDDEKFYASILTTLAQKKILKRKKNADGVFEYSAKK
jgi:hypothetical protein